MSITKETISRYLPTLPEKFFWLCTGIITGNFSGSYDSTHLLGITVNPSHLTSTAQAIGGFAIGYANKGRSIKERLVNVALLCGGGLFGDFLAYHGHDLFALGRQAFQSATTIGQSAFR